MKLQLFERLRGAWPGEDLRPAGSKWKPFHKVGLRRPLPAENLPLVVVVVVVPKSCVSPSWSSWWAPMRSGAIVTVSEGPDRIMQIFAPWACNSRAAPNVADDRAASDA